MNIPLSHFHQRIAESTAEVDGSPAVIVAIGDSVTYGATTPGGLAGEDVYHHRLKRKLEERFPRAAFNVINAGVAGESLPDGLARLECDVLRHQPDLVLIAFGLNDAPRGLESLDDFAAGLAQMIRRIREHGDADVILMTPNMMLTRMNDAIPDCWEEVAPRLLATQREGALAAYADRIGQVAGDMEVAVADVYQAWGRLAAAGVDTTAMLANGLNHPTAEAHAIAADVLLNVIMAAAPGAVARRPMSNESSAASA